MRHKHPLYGAQSLPDNLSQSAAVLTGVCDSSEGTLCLQQLHPPYTHLCAHLPRELALGEASFSPSLALVLCLPQGRALCAALGTAISRLDSPDVAADIGCAVAQRGCGGKALCPCLHSGS